MSWIHLHDWVSMVTWAIETADVTGVLNATAPKPVTNKAFSKSLGRAIHRPSLLPSPPFVLRLLFGEMADAMLLTGQRVMPKKALEMKFGFRYPDVDLAMRAALARE
jgi:NAD dependent epimerase/dehydratase family enzyme